MKDQTSSEGSEHNWEQVADGLALWEEHKPQSPEDWIKVARRCNRSSDFEIAKASPLFAALCIAVDEADRLWMVSP